jgi:pimeloyl-ACP methyl ester carboxylesterase
LRSPVSRADLPNSLIMSEGTEPRRLSFTVGDADIGALEWPSEPGAPTLVAVHGITANAWTYGPVAQIINGAMRVVAVDLRGRGASSSAPAPYGIRRHAEDVAAIILQLAGIRGEGPVVLSGHSMGTYVALICAEHHPDLISELILVDGAVSLPLPPGVDPQAQLDQVLGPSLARLRQTWDSPEAYRQMWEAHPAFAAGISPAVERYIMDDLITCPEGYRSKVHEPAVRQDGAELLLDEKVRSSLDRQTHPITMIRAELGILAGPTPLIPAEQMDRYPQHTWITIPGSNHYDVLMGEEGARATAMAALRAVGLN